MLSTTRGGTLVSTEATLSNVQLAVKSKAFEVKSLFRAYGNPSRKGSDKRQPFLGQCHMGCSCCARDGVSSSIEGASDELEPVRWARGVPRRSVLECKGSAPKIKPAL